MPAVAIVDDISTNRLIYSKVATSIQDDIVVKAFESPLDALRWVEEHEVDLVIVDYKMPGMDGAEFTIRFRASPKGADTPIVVITAYEDRAFRLKALDAGATDFLQSPVDPSEFKTRIRNLLKLSFHQKLILARAETLEEELRNSERSRDQALRDSRERLAQVIDTIPAMISASDLGGRRIFANAYQAEVAGLDRAHLVDREIPAMFGADYLDRHRHLHELVCATRAPLPAFEEEIRTVAGETLTFLTTKSPLQDTAGAITGVLTTSLDITARKRAESRLSYLAAHDYLTALPNRTLLQERLEQEFARGRRGGHSFALLFVDLDRFKSINDGLGHRLGDKLLQAVAARLTQVVRGGDTVARIGGDEFVIVQAGISGPDDAAGLARRVNEALDVPFVIEDKELMVNASVGIAIYPKDGRSTDKLLQNADLAMYRVKISGRRNYQFFANDMLAQAQSSIQIQSDLRRALAQEQFVLHYQPQIDLRTNEIVGVEALVRWQRPGWGLLAPATFLPFAEESGLIVPINEWVLREACRRGRSWLDAWGRGLRIAVNLAPAQVQRDGLYDLVCEILDSTGLPPSLLELELTESTLPQHAAAASAQLAELQRHGVRVSIDDFGTGQSSLTHLKLLHVDRVKIDRSFIEDLHSADSDDLAIVRAVVSLGRAMRIEVLAEGVETEEQATALQAEGCYLIQGFLFSEPRSGEEIEAFLQEQRRMVGSGAEAG